MRCDKFLKTNTHKHKEREDTVNHINRLLIVVLMASAGCASIGWNKSDQKSVMTHTMDDGVNPIKTNKVAIEGNVDAFSAGVGADFGAVPGGNGGYGYGAGAYGGGYGYGPGGMPNAFNVPVMVTTPVVEYTVPVATSYAPAPVTSPEQANPDRVAAIEERLAKNERNTKRLAEVTKRVEAAIPTKTDTKN